MGENVGVGDGVSVLVGVVWEITVTPVATVLPNVGGRMMKGVAVTMLGVIVGMGVQTGKGWGGAPQVSHDVMNMTRKKSTEVFFIH